MSYDNQQPCCSKQLCPQIFTSDDSDEDVVSSDLCTDVSVAASTDDSSSEIACSKIVTGNLSAEEKKALALQRRRERNRLTRLTESSEKKAQRRERNRNEKRRERKNKVESCEELDAKRKKNKMRSQKYRIKKKQKLNENVDISKPEKQIVEDLFNDSSSCSEFSDESDGNASESEIFTTFKSLEPNDPKVVQKFQNAFIHKMKQVAGSFCDICERIMHSFKVFDIEYWKWNSALRNSGPDYVDFVCDDISSYVRVCSTCKSSILSGKVPTLAVVNGFKYPKTPSELPPLTEVAEHILALRVPFQQVTNLGKMGRKGQYGLKGSVINIPIEPVQNLYHLIPLFPKEDELYIVNLKRKLIHKRPYASSFVSKNILEIWCEFLVNTELYLKHEVKFDRNRLLSIPECVEEEPLEVFDGQPQYTILMADLLTIQSSVNVDSCTTTIDFAPGENVKPLSVVWDREAEELSFPSVYLGNARKFKIPVTRFQAMKSEIRRVDRRGARPQPLLYKYAVHCREQACRRLRHKFRRRAAVEKGGNVTKSELLDPSFTICSQRKGLAIPNLLPNSAQYWKSIGHDVFAMVRQLDKPTLFLTVSAAEYHWPILLNTLQRLSTENDHCISSLVNEMVQCVESELNVECNQVSCNENVPCCSMSSDERLKLIREDPVVCAMYFKQVVDELKSYLKCRNGPMGMYRMIDYVFRIEFQVRGSPHLHALLWLENAPTDPLKNVAETVAFIDALISCDSTLPNAEKNLHKHTPTCFKKKSVLNRFYSKELTEEDMHRHCRFGVPFWPSNETRILLPVYHSDENKLTFSNYRNWEEHYDTLKKLLNDNVKNDNDNKWLCYLSLLKTMKHKLKDILVSKDCPLQFEEFLKAASCPDLETYLLIIRTSIIRPFILYKRSMADIRTNPSMPWVGKIIDDNNDTQFVLDAYSLVRYCVGYMTKGEKAHSDLYKLLLRLRREKGYDDKELLYRISSEALRSKETSAQEAAWVLLKFPMSEKSRMCQFIDTSPFGERTRCPKLIKDLESLADDATDIWKPDIYDKYADRPGSLESISLAVFAASYYNCNRKVNNFGEPVARMRDRIIRYRKFKCNTENTAERENYFRALVTLHVPWRNEVNDILKPVEEYFQFSSFEHMYNENLDCIMDGRRRFECNVDMEIDLDKEVEKCVAEDDVEETEMDELIRRYVCGSGKYIFEEDEEYMDIDSQSIDIDIPRNDFTSVRHVAALRSCADWTRDELNKVIRTLNRLQRFIVLLIIHEIRLRSKPQLIYIGGSAGVGKSVVARCLANAFEMFSAKSNSGAGKCVVSAPTGKAADNINGRTIHNVYMLPVNQNKKSAVGKLLYSSDDCTDAGFDPLPPDSLAQLQNQFIDMNAQIIDEVSMLSQSQLILIDQRCQQATGQKGIPFGGLWTIVFGDFRQLPPIGGESLMEKSKTSLAGAFPLWSKFSHLELTENMRQGEDRVFAEILRKIGGYETLTDDERLLIESRFVSKNNLQVPKDAVRIYATNYEVDQYSSSILLQNENSKILILEARDRIEEISSKLQFISNSAKNKANDRNEAIFNSARNLNTTQARGLPFKLIAVVGYCYLVTKNIDTADGLVNGAVGKLVWVEFGTIKKTSFSTVPSTEDVVPKRLWMQFPGKTGSAANRKYRSELRCAIANAYIFKDKVHPYELPTSPTESEIQCVVPIEREDLTLNSVWTESWRSVKRQQFPLTSALALTVFKIQGSTKDSVYTYYDPNISNAEVYVSFSRVTKLSGLYIDDSKVIPNEKGHYFQHPPSLDDDGDKKLLYKDLKRLKTRKHYKERYLAEEKRLREKSLTIPWQNALDLLCENTKFLYHNVQSLHAHFSDIVMDEVYTDCDVLFLAETHLLPSESVSMPCGFVQVARCDGSSLNRSGGVAIFSKLPCSVMLPIEIEEMEIAITIVNNRVKAAVVYCHKKSCCAAVIKCLETIALCEPKEVPFIICGDFNVEMRRILEQECFKRLQMMTCINLKSSCEEKTTYCDYGEGSCIDGVFSTIENMRVKTYQSYFSYHLPLVFSMDL